MTQKKTPPSEVKDRGLAPEGRLRIEWASRQMPVLNLIGERFAQKQLLKGLRIAGCLHITTETANLARALARGGGQVALCASNPLSTQDDVAAALAEEGMAVYAIRGEDEATYYRHIRHALAQDPDITLDDGADLTATVHKERPDLLPRLRGGTEETTTGVVRLRSMAQGGALRYPIVAVNEALTKHLFDNRYGTGQSTVDGITRATNILWAGRKVVVCGYGWCGRGIALRARGLGAHVIVTEIDPIRAIEAVMDGHQVMPLLEAAALGDVFITATGDVSVIGEAHLRLLKDGAILANSGHFNVEIDIPALEKLSTQKRRVRPHVDEYQMADGRRAYLLGEGRLINLAAAEGHPASVMDMSFANQALAVAHLATMKERLAPGVYPVPNEIDQEVGRLKLEALGIAIDTLSEQQRKYLASWESGT